MLEKPSNQRSEIMSPSHSSPEDSLDIDFSLDKLDEGISTHKNHNVQMLSENIRQASARKRRWDQHKTTHNVISLDYNKVNAQLKRSIERANSLMKDQQKNTEQLSTFLTSSLTVVSPNNKLDSAKNLKFSVQNTMTSPSRDYTSVNFNFKLVKNQCQTFSTHREHRRDSNPRDQSLLMQKSARKSERLSVHSFKNRKISHNNSVDSQLEDQLKSFVKMSKEIVYGAKKIGDLKNTLFTPKHDNEQLKPYLSPQLSSSCFSNKSLKVIQQKQSKLSKKLIEVKTLIHKSDKENVFTTKRRSEVKQKIDSKKKTVAKKAHYLSPQNAGPFLKPQLSSTKKNFQSQRPSLATNSKTFIAYWINNPEDTRQQESFCIQPSDISNFQFKPQYFKPQDQANNFSSMIQNNSSCKTYRDGKSTLRENVEYSAQKQSEKASTNCFNSKRNSNASSKFSQHFNLVNKQVVGKKITKQVPRNTITRKITTGAYNTKN